MLRYEVLFLTVPEITGDEASAIESSITTAVRAAKANVISFERWGKYRLAYPVKKNDYGVYFLSRFEVEKENRDKLLKDIKNAFVFKYNTVIVKDMFARLSDTGSLDYKRLESLEDNPHDVDSFLKKNDMGGLLNKKEAAPQAVEPATEVVEKTAAAEEVVEEVSTAQEQE